MQARTLLAEQHRRPELQSNSYCCYGEHRKQQYQRDNGNDEVERSLDAHDPLTSRPGLVVRAGPAGTR
jgi:hypothetical protein